MGTCKECNVRHPDFYCPKRELQKKQALKLQVLMKEQLAFQKSIDPNYTSTSLVYILQSMIKESER